MVKVSCKEVLTMKYNFIIKEVLKNGYLLVNESGQIEISKDDLKYYEEYICSVCKGVLSKSEVERYIKTHEDLDFNWGMCGNKEASIEKRY